MNDWEMDNYEVEVSLVDDQIRHADKVHPGGFRNFMQTVMVIKEEMDEVWEWLKKDFLDIEEVSQVAACSVRALRDVCGKKESEVFQDVFSSDFFPFSGDEVSPKECFGYIQWQYDHLWENTKMLQEIPGHEAFIIEIRESLVNIIGCCLVMLSLRTCDLEVNKIVRGIFRYRS